MADIGLCREALEDSAGPGVRQHFGSKCDKRLVNVVVGNSCPDALQISTRHRFPCERQVAAKEPVT